MVLFAWGANKSGQLGLGHHNDQLLPCLVQWQPVPQPAVPAVKAICGGGAHSALVTDSGDLYVCGQNSHGQLGLGHLEDVANFTRCPALPGCSVAKVACGWEFTLILTVDGQLFSCGSDSHGQLGLGTGSKSSSAHVSTPVKVLEHCLCDIAAGLRHSLAITWEGTVLQWGLGMLIRARRAGTVPSYLQASTPSAILGLPEDMKFVQVSAGAHHSAALSVEGKVFLWGDNSKGQILQADKAFVPHPMSPDLSFLEEKVSSMASGWSHIVVNTGTKVLAWGRGDYGQLGDDGLFCGTGEKALGARVKRTITGLCHVRAVACGSEHTLAIAKHTVMSWGWNEHGMCGTGNETNVHVPRAVAFTFTSEAGAPSSADAVLVGAGAGHSFAVCNPP
uniref:secretion-regulating guanine nucleotide exchange factor isoform X2 n=1 Tax=Myxine glutinosa TaxID=7769 RepID=UPI00358F5350